MLGVLRQHSQVNISKGVAFFNHFSIILNSQGTLQPSNTSHSPVTRLQVNRINLDSMLLCQEGSADVTDFKSVGQILLYLCFPPFVLPSPKEY